VTFEDDRPPGLTYEVPPRLRVGAYANAARISFTQHEFTMDWAVMDEDVTGLDVGERVAIVCARVRIPVGLIFEVLQGIKRAMTYYEHQFGEIRRPDA